MSVAGIISSIWRFVFPGPEKKVPDIFDDGGVKIFGQRRRDTCCRDGRDEGDLVTVFAHAVQDCGRGEEGGEIIGGVFFWATVRMGLLRGSMTAFGSGGGSGGGLGVREGGGIEYMLIDWGS